MKKIKELGISPGPWTHENGEQSVRHGRTSNITGTHFPVCSRGAFIGDREWDADARLIAAAPELYECLYMAVEEQCAEYCKIYGLASGECPNKGKHCLVHRWRNALAKAGGGDNNEELK